DIRIVSGNPDAEEIAAVTAVVSAALDELGGEHRRRQNGGPSSWQRSQRAVRTPLVRGAWRTSGR
ncbi:MAG TPA: acyl-CoA carboxylase epsilon subunit, partial [Pseudolysinimonas sp.]